MHVNAPPLEVQREASITIVPVIVTDVSARENPFPDTDTVVPITPVVGDSAMVGTVTVNVAVAVSAATPRLPTAVIV